MSREEYVPYRGDIVWLSFSPTAGHEQAGRRPALVISPAPYNDRSVLALVCPITARARGYPFEVALASDSGIHGVALADQVRSVDWRARGAERAGTTTPAVVAEALAKLATLVS